MDINLEQIISAYNEKYKNHSLTCAGLPYGVTPLELFEWLISALSANSIDRESIKKLYDEHSIHGEYQTRHPHLMTFEGFVASVSALVDKTNNEEPNEFGSVDLTNVEPDKINSALQAKLLVNLVLNYVKQVSQFRLELYNIMYVAPNISTTDREKAKATLDRFNELTRSYEDEIKKTITVAHADQTSENGGREEKLVEVIAAVIATYRVSKQNGEELSGYEIIELVRAIAKQHLDEFASRSKIQNGGREEICRLVRDDPPGELWTTSCGVRATDSEVFNGIYCPFCGKRVANKFGLLKSKYAPKSKWLSARQKEEGK